MARQSGNDFLCRAMRQRAENQVHSRPVRVLDLDHGWQINMGKMRENFPERTSGASVCSQQGNFRSWMMRKNANQFRPGIATGTENSDFDLNVAHIKSCSKLGTRKTAGIDNARMLANKARRCKQLGGKYA